MNQQILRSALQREMKAAEDDLRSVFWKVSRLIQFDGSKYTQAPGYENPRGEVEKAIAMLSLAAQYYDSVKAQLDHASTEPTDAA